MKNIRVTVDAGCVNFYWTDERPRSRPNGDLDAVFSTLAAAKRWAVQMSLPERDQWADAVRSARSATRYDVMGSQ